MNNRLNLFSSSSFINNIAIVIILFFISLLFQIITIENVIAGSVIESEKTSIVRIPTMIDNPQYNIDKPEDKSGSRECYWMSYFENIGYTWKAPQPTYGDESYAMRFEGYNSDTLKLVEFYVYDPGDGTFGDDTVFISVWGNNFNDIPDINNMIAQIAFPPGSYNAYPTVTTADFNEFNLVIPGSIHISFSSSGEFPDSYETTLSDDGLNGTGRSSTLVNGIWGSLDTIWSADVNFAFSVQICGPNVICFADLDGDTFGDIDNIYVSPCGHCHEELGFMYDSTDCDDTDSTIYPGAYDIPDDGIDQNCDGVDSTCCLLRGDVAIPVDGMVLVDDVVFLVNWLFKGGVPLHCMEEGDCAMPLDGQVLVNDVVWLVDYIFKGGDAPPDCEMQ